MQQAGGAGRAGERPRHGDRRAHPAHTRAAACSTSSRTWSSSAACRATRSRRTAPTCCSTAPSSRERLDPLDASRTPTSPSFLSELAAGDGEPPAVAPATLQRKVACLRSFHRHLRREDLIDDDPTAHIKAPRQGRKLPKVLTRDEVGHLLEQPRGTEPAALRDRALLELMYACGLRASRGDRPRRRATSTSRPGVLRARGKGSKERLVPVGGAALRALSPTCSAAAAAARRRCAHESRLFVNHRGRA